MKDILFQILTIAYGATGLIGLVAYWPTINDLYHHKKASANVWSYILWTSTAGIGFLYAIFILPDPLLRIVTGTNFFACLAVLILSIRLKHK